MESFIFDDEILRFMAKKNYFDFCKQNDFYCPYNISLREQAVLSIFFSDKDDQVYKKYINKASAIAVRKWRLKLRIDYMINNFKCMFVTFTLSNDYINKDVKYLRDYITKRVLKNMNCFFVGNIDYGSSTERLHFHFVVASDDKQFIKDNYKIGFSDIEVITSKNAYRLSNYIDKLTLHAIKVETKNRYSIITSRGDFSFTSILKNYRLCDKKSIKKNFIEDNRKEDLESEIC